MDGSDSEQPDMSIAENAMQSIRSTTRFLHTGMESLFPTLYLYSHILFFHIALWFLWFRSIKSYLYITFEDLIARTILCNDRYRDNLAYRRSG